MSNLVAAVFNDELVLVRKATADNVISGLAPFERKGQVLQTSLSKDTEEGLRRALEA